MAAVANVAVNLDSRGVPAKLKQIADRGKEVSVAVDRMNGNVGKSSRQFKNAGVAASQASAGFSKLGKAIGGIVTAAAAFQALKFTIVKTAELETQTRSLKVLTGSLESAQVIIKQLQDIGAVTPFTSTELIDTAKRLKAFGVETNKLVDTTKRLGDLAGATGAELNGIATAYGQIQAKGKLQTEELLQLQERGIDIASTLKEEYKLTGAEFTKALEKGQISAEAVEFALKKLTDTGGKYADGAIAQSDTLAGKFSTLQDNIGRFAQSIGQVLTPALNGILDQINTLIAGFNQLFEIGGVERGLRQAGALDDSSRNQLFREATKEAERLLSIGRVTKDTFGQVRLDIFQESLKGLAVNEGLIKPTITKPDTVTLPPLMQGGGGGGGGGTGGGGSAKPQKSIGQQVAELNEIVEVEGLISKARLAGNEILVAQYEAYKRQLEIQQRGLDPQLEELELKRNGIQLDEKLKELDNARLERLGQFLQGTKELVETQNDVVSNYQQETNLLEMQSQKGEAFVQKFKDINRLMMEGGLSFSEAFSRVEERTAAMASLNKEADMFQQALSGVGDILGNQLMNVFDGLINKTVDFNDVLRSTLSQVGRLLMTAGLNQLAGADGAGILSFLGFGTRANGGPVQGGQPYMVGERGPELFVPSGNGGVMRNEDMRQLMGRSPVSNAPAMNFTFETTNIGGTEYVSREQLEAAMATTRRQATNDGAKRGMNMTLDRMQNSPRTRARVGIA